ncbi:hypothetical protein GCM10010245_66840 [Streptomyces spectabilis]|uniref:Uncharacterized protein n=1 Tax=Streptomyces spectabilis TaxID=68270 RepID=A0A7W8EYG5_STRST|nr:hypothetical protein [Streptomyces spectabilis]GGV42616.1 hypothetical protein GCM10010245_66840 [Streptomyces spectabilis]
MRRIADLYPAEAKTDARDVLIVAVSCIPPLVLGHLLHLAATPVRVTPVVTKAQPVTAPVVPPASAEVPEPAPEPIAYNDPRCAVIRPLYDGLRPGTKAIRTAIVAAGFEAPSYGVIRGQLRTEVEQHEPHLAAPPPAPVAFSA